jgi:DNA-binding FadR family transcriptional regulator
MDVMATSIEDVMKRLRHIVERGRYGPGERLPAERELATALGSTRHTVREALAVLEAEGKVWRHVGQGTFVGRRPIETLEDLTAVARAATPAAVVEARMAIEPVIARFASQRVTSDLIQQLNRSATKAEAAKDVHGFDRWDERFHRTVVEAAGNPLFEAWSEVVAGIWSRMAWGSHRDRAYTPEVRRILTKQHRRIAEAIENRELDRSRNLVLEHWRTMRNVLIADPTN